MVKYDKTGTRLWTRLIGTSGSDDANSVTTDGKGNVYVAGSTTGARLHGQTSNGRSGDGYVVKYDNTGTRQWTRLIGTSGPNGADSVTADGQGNVYVAGLTGAGLHGQNYNGGLDGYVVKYDNTGTRQWTRLIGSSDRDVAESVTTDGQGNVYVAGWTEKGLQGQSYNGGREDGYVAKYDNTGTHHWTRLIGTSDSDGADSVTADGQGNVYVAGPTGAGLHGQLSNGGLDGYVVKYASSGTRQWTRLIGSSGSDGSRSVTTDGQGNVYAAGLTRQGLNGQAYNGGGADGYVIQMNR